MKEILKALKGAMVILVKKLASIKFVVWIVLTIITTTLTIKLQATIGEFAAAEAIWTGLLFAANQTQKITESKERMLKIKAGIEIEHDLS
jgi:hypothetical protein